MKKGIGYYRVSTLAQDITRQRKLVEAYCEENDILLVKSYEDKITGTTFNREALNQLLDCDTNDGDIVVISEFSRFSRDANLLSMMNEFDKLTSKGFDVVFLDDPSKIYKGGCPLPIADIILLIFKGYAAQEERKAIINRLQEKKKQLIEATPNAVIGSKIPYGYKIIANPERLLNPKNRNIPRKLMIVNESEAEIVRQIFNRYADGESITSLTLWFITNIRWVNECYISRMLNNATYIGNRTWGSKRLRITPIIEMDTWDKVQERKKANRKYCQNTKRGSINLLKGLLHCGRCGSRMTLYYTQQQQDYRNQSYLCLNHSQFPQRNADYCDNSFGIQRRVLELIVKKSYIEIEGTEAFQRTMQDAIDKLKKEKENIELLKSNLQKEITNKENERKKIPQIILTQMLNDALVQSLNDMDLSLQEEIRKRRKQLSGYKEQAREIEFEISRMQKHNLKITPSITQAQLAEEFQRTISKVTVYSPYRSCHFIAIEYKSGYQATFLCRSFGKRAKIAEIVGGKIEPHTMKYKLKGKQWDWHEIFDVLQAQGLIKETLFE